LEFPGNVRQLENLCNWITVMAPGQLVEIIDLPSDLTRVGDVAAVSAQDVALEIPVINQPESQILTSCLQSSTSSTLPVDWHQMLESEASAMLSSGEPEVIVQLGKIFEATVIKAALRHTHGRKNEAAIKLGIGRNTITRKIQELNILDVRDDSEI
jgi:two-component system nitrogen regulation response regulator GlnG